VAILTVIQSSRSIKHVSDATGPPCHGRSGRKDGRSGQCVACAPQS
jgi:hypothetical protein